MLNVDTIIAASVCDDQEALAKEAGENVFGELRDYAKGYSTKDVFESSLVGMEVEFMEKYMSTEKFKNGDWKWSKLPTKWRTAKSVIGTALDQGINLGFKGKSEIEKRIKAKKKEAQPYGIERFSKDLDSLRKKWKTLTEVDRDAYANHVRECMEINND